MLVKKLLLVMLINIVDGLEAQMWNILRSSKMSGLFVVVRVSKTQSQEWSFRCLLVIFQFFINFQRQIALILKPGGAQL